MSIIIVAPRMLKIFRTNIWWNVVVPQVLGWIYFCWLCNGINIFQDIYPSFFIFGIGAFFISLISISAFGYLFNDWCDAKSDLVAGKKNLLSTLNPAWQFVIVIIPLLIGCFFWLPTSKIATVLFALQIISLIIYSAPPFRLKNRGLLGVLSDAFYGHINPVFITLFAFNFFDNNFSVNAILFLVALTMAVSLKGIRNILLHQLDDRKKDRKAGIQTFVVKNGALFTLNFINNLIPFELFFTFALVVPISIFSPPFFLSFLFFVLLTYLKFSGWKLSYLPKRQLRFKFLYFLNDYYEGWIPVFFLILLSTRSPVFLILLLLHLVFFPAFWNKLSNAIKTIKQNFKTEDEY